MHPDKEARLIKSAQQEQAVVDALLMEGMSEADRTPGPAYKNRKQGDIWFRMTPTGPQHAIELQVAEGDEKRRNFTLSLDKKDKFAGYDGRCFYMFGNEKIEQYMIVETEFLNGAIDAYDRSNRDVILFLKDGEYVVVSPSGLAASNKCRGFGKSIDECVSSFISWLRADSV